MGDLIGLAVVALIGAAGGYLYTINKVRQAFGVKSNDELKALAASIKK